MIKIENLTKSFALAKDAKNKSKHQQVKDPREHDKVFHALQGVSFQCEKGEVLGLLGPNGAGKTTTLRILSAALKPDSGAIFINEVDVVKDPLLAKKKIGFLSGKTGLYGKLTARENIEYFAKLHGMSQKEIAHQAEKIYSELGIEAYLDRRVETFSTGMQQKVSIARAVIHQPDVLVLDEPTTGLDIMATQTIMEFIQNVKAQGTPVIFSTHHLDEVSLLADKIAVIDQGLTRFSGSVSDFQRVGGAIDLRTAFMNILNQEDNNESENKEAC